MKISLKAAVVVAVLAGHAAPALAICAGNQETLFSCSVGEKQIELCLTAVDQSVTYRFGPDHAPEIELTRDFGEISMRPWNGIGRNIWDSVTVPNGNFAYEIYWSFDKIDQQAQAGLNVLRGAHDIATLACLDAEDGSAILDLGTLSFAMQDAGFCRIDTSDPLRMGPCE